MLKGFRPKVRRQKLPLTQMAADAIAGNSSVNLKGYRDYRGVPVVGAWTWLPKYQVGITTEVDVAQAFRPLVLLQRIFWVLFVLLILATIAILISTLLGAKARREAQKQALESKQLGQYTLEDKLGSGGMGVVYKGYHAMMRRPTAVKMLHLDNMNDQLVGRFEKEVQLTCQLNNPNTIAIYDYGRTPEGIFYYAMEYLEGIDLQQLVEQFGPLSPERAVRVLVQICQSLFEAHSMGLVHRDIKPANIMLNRRGGIPDFVKVLDFGLVKAMGEEQLGKSATAGSLTGTPLYMSPEAIQTPFAVDGRSDIYAVGAVGYFLLTGRPVFRGENLVDLCNMHATSIPQPISDLIADSISPELESAILKCLEKSISKRPQTTRELESLLRQAPEFDQWNVEKSEIWWANFERRTKSESQDQNKQHSDPASTQSESLSDKTILGE